MTDLTQAERKPMLVRCEPCGHVWPAAYVPMKMSAVAKLLKGALCPMCAAGGRAIFTASAEQTAKWAGEAFHGRL